MKIARLITCVRLQFREFIPARAWVSVGIVTALTTTLAFAKNKIAAGWLGPAGVGLLSQATAFLTLVGSLCMLGMGQGIVKHLAERADGPVDGATREDVISAVLRIQLIIAFSFTICIFLFSRFLARWLFSDEGAWSTVVFVGAAVPFVVLSSNFGYFLQGYRQLTRFSVASVASVACNLAAFIFLTWLYGLEGAIFGLLIGAGASVVVFWLSCRVCIFSSVARDTTHRSPSHNLSLSLARYGLVVILSGGLESLSLLILRSWIVNSLGPTQNGIYQAVIGLSGQYLGFFSLLNNAYLYPQLSVPMRDSERSRVICHTIRFSTFFSLPALVALILFRRPVMVLLFTPAFLPAAELLSWQVLGDYLKIVSWFLTASLLPTGQLRTYIQLAFLYTSLSLSLSFVFLQHWHLPGLVVANCVTYAIYIVVVRILQVRERNLALDSCTIRLVLCSSLLLVSLAFFGENRPSHHSARLAASVLWLLVVLGLRSRSVGSLSTMT